MSLLPNTALLVSSYAMSVNAQIIAQAVNQLGSTKDKDAEVEKKLFSELTHKTEELKSYLEKFQETLLLMQS